MESYYVSLKGAVRLGITIGNASYHVIGMFYLLLDIFPAIPYPLTCVSLESADNGFANMTIVLGSGVFVTERVNKFYYDKLLSRTLIDFTNPNFYDGYVWTEKFSVAQITFDTFKFFESHLSAITSDRKDIRYFITDNSTGMITGATADVLKWLFDDDRLDRTYYLQDAFHNFNQLINFFDNTKTIENRANIVIKDDDDTEYYVSYLLTNQRAGLMYWSFINYKNLQGIIL